MVKVNSRCCGLHESGLLNDLLLQVMLGVPLQIIHIYLESLYSASKRPSSSVIITGGFCDVFILPVFTQNTVGSTVMYFALDLLLKQHFLVKGGMFLAHNSLLGIFPIAVVSNSFMCLQTESVLILSGQHVYGRSTSMSMSKIDYL